MTPGEWYALGAAMTWASAVILFQRTGERLPPVPLNLFKTALSLVLLAGTLVLIGEPLLPELSGRDLGLLIASGVVGITLSDTLFLYGLRYLGASRSAVVECLYSPFIILLSIACFGDQIATTDGIGLVLVLAAVVTVARPERGKSRTPRSGSGPSGQPLRLGIGVACGVGAMATLAIGVVLFDPVTENASVFTVCTVRTAAAVATLWPLALFTESRASFRACFVPSSLWFWMVPASILGTYVALLFWIGGFAHAANSRAAILNQSNTVFVIVLAAIFLRDPVTPRKLVAVALGIGGVCVVLLGRPDPAPSREARLDAVPMAPGAVSSTPVYSALRCPAGVKGRLDDSTGLSVDRRRALR